jgi:hypothetical protein
MQPYRLTVDKFLDHAAKWFRRPRDRRGGCRRLASAGLTAPVVAAR